MQVALNEHDAEVDVAVRQRVIGPVGLGGVLEAGRTTGGNAVPQHRVPTAALLLVLAEATATLGANVRSKQYTLFSVVLRCTPLMPFEPESVTVALVTLTWA
jgi:hypothetical protein